MIHRRKHPVRAHQAAGLGAWLALTCAAGLAPAQAPAPADDGSIVPALPPETSTPAPASPSAPAPAPASSYTLEARAQSEVELAEPSGAEASVGSDAEAQALADSLAASVAADQTAAAAADSDELRLSLYGFADFTYTHRLNDFAFASPYPTFLVGNLNLYVDTELGAGFRSLIEFRLLYLPNGQVPPDQALLSEPIRTNTTVGDPADLARPLRWGGIEIERAYLEYYVHPLLTIRGGQWLTPYGIWNVDHGSPVIIGARRPYVVGEALIPERQTGLQIFGSHLVGTTELGYNLSVSNGRGPIDEYQDLDKNKAVTARLFASNDSPVGNVTLGFTLYRGRFTDRFSRFAFSPTFEAGTEWISQNRYDELAVSGDLRWIWQDLIVQGEFMMREVALDDRFRTAAFPAPGEPQGFSPDFRSVGYYAMAGYRLPWLGIMPFFGGEKYDPGQELVFAAAAVWGGLNIRPTPRVVLKAQLTKSWFTDDAIQLVGDEGIEAMDLQAAWSF